MNRNYEQYPGDGAAIARFERWADSRATDIEVAAAIHTIAGGTRPASAIWENPTNAENDNIEMCLNEWARLGDIEPGTYRWGSETITVSDV